MFQTPSKENSDVLAELRMVLTADTPHVSATELQLCEELLLEFSANLSTISDGLSQSETQEVQNNIAQSVRPWFLQSDIARHIITKPLGYAGDYQLIHKIYRNEPVGESSVGRKLDEVLLNTAAAKAVRNRRHFLADRIRSCVLGSAEQARIMSLACGPAVEVLDVLESSTLEHRPSFHLIDMDARALTFVRENASQYGLSDAIHLHRKDLTKVDHWGNDAIGSCSVDLAYSMGLIDYFDDLQVIRLMNAMYDMLRPGARLILGNFHPHNPFRGLMDYVLDWKLIHRSETEMHQLCSSSSFGKPFDRIEFEPENINLIATVTK